MDQRAEPLHDMLRRIRQPVALRDIIAQCLRHIHMGDPFADEQISLTGISEELASVSVTETTIAQTRCLVYRPPTAVAKLPVILYMHGGGFVAGCPEDTDYITRRLCADNNCAVVSVDYPLAPEMMFPGALNICVGVARALAEQPLENFDMTRFFVAGDSAGGNLAVGTALELRRYGQPTTGQVLFAPWLDMSVETYASFNQLAADGIVFDAPFIAFARAAYAHPFEWMNPLVSPTHVLKEPGPPALIICGTDDPMIDQARKVRTEKEKDAQVHLIEFAGMPHCFYQFPGLFEEDKVCYKKISEFLGALGCS